MKKSFTIIALAALVMLAGCKKNEEQPTGTTKLTVGIEQHKSDSKTSLDSLQINWTADDQLYVYDKDGEAPAYFNLISGAGTPTGVFEGSYNFTDENVAVYPISCMYMVDNKSLQINLPATQTASGSGSFGNGANPMLGVFSDINDFTLTSLCGVLCLQLTGDNVEITAIEIEGGAADMLSGRFKINDYTNPALSYLSNGTNKVTLNFTEKVTLTAMPQKFYVVLPPVHLTGLTMNVYNNADIIFTQSTTTSFTAFDITANTIDSMDPVEVTLTPAAPAGAINSIFNVGTSASPKYVYFSEGNLQYSQSADKWSFMEHQYDMVETTGMNVGTNYADQDIVSLFGWGTGNNPTKTGGGAAEYENYTEWGTNTIYSGTTATTNWRTLTRDEWDNLFANHQYGYVMISNGSQWICGVAIDPSSTTSLNTDHSHWSNNIYWTGLDAFIADAEAGGWLFLPAAGLRTGTSVTKVSDPSSGAGYYWSSTKEYDSLLECYQSNYLLIKSNDDAMINRNLGFIGHSVRLVKDAN